MLKCQTPITACDARLLAIPLFSAPFLKATHIWCLSLQESGKHQHRNRAVRSRSALHHHGPAASSRQTWHHKPHGLVSACSRTQFSVEESTSSSEASNGGRNSSSDTRDQSSPSRNSSYSINGSLDGEATSSYPGIQQRTGRTTPNASHIASQGSAAESAPAIHGLAKAMQRSGKLKDALALASRGLARFPSNLPLRSLTASLESKTGNHVRAAQLCEEGLQQEPNNVHLLTTAATAEGRAGHTQASRALFQKADRLNPGNAVLLQVCAGAGTGEPSMCVSQRALVFVRQGGTEAEMSVRC